MIHVECVVQHLLAGSVHACIWCILHAKLESSYCIVNFYLIGWFTNLNGLHFMYEGEVITGFVACCKSLNEIESFEIVVPLFKKKICANVV